MHSLRPDLLTAATSNIFRYANGKPDQLARLAAELVVQKPDILLAVGGDVIKPRSEASKGAIPDRRWL